jgi:lauroyl/myristoyl acyltransferase
MLSLNFLSTTMQSKNIPRRFDSHLRMMGRIARLPWPFLWLVGGFLCRNRWGRRYMMWRSPHLCDKLAFSRQLFAAMELPPEQVDRGLMQVYQNGLFQPILLARLAEMSRREEAGQFEVFGWEHLAAERASGRPVILGGSHFGVNRLFSLWLARRGVEVLSLARQDLVKKLPGTKPPTLKVVEIGDGFTVETALLVMRHLRSGGCLQVTGDWPIQRQSPHSYQRTYKGITRLYPQGMANFSLTGGAAILPYFCKLQPSGAVRIEIYPPLRPPHEPAPAGSKERETQIEDLLHRFASVLEAEIERSPGIQCWV